MEKEFVSENKENGIAIASDIKQNIEKILHHCATILYKQTNGARNRMGVEFKL